MVKYKHRHTFRYEGKRYDIKADSEKELWQKVAEKKRQLEDGSRIVSPNTTVSQWAERWLETYKQKSIEDVTLKGYKTRLKHILSEIGKMKLKDVNAIHCQNVLNNLEGYSEDMINKVGSIMFQMFKKAKKNHLMKENPADDLDRPKGTKGSHRDLTDKEQQILLKVAEYHRGGLWVLTMRYCGLRPSETERSLWSHVDFESGTLFVDGQKTKNATRTVPIPDFLLKKFKEAQGKPFDLIFTNIVGNKLNNSSRTTLWNNYKREMNVAVGCRVYRNQLIPPLPIADNLVPYCLRHTFCTDMKYADVPYPILQDIMGHQNNDITHVYTHRRNEGIIKAKALLEDYWKSKVETMVVTPFETVEK